jgi:hypothetical protein
MITATLEAAGAPSANGNYVGVHQGCQQRAQCL